MDEHPARRLPGEIVPEFRLEHTYNLKKLEVDLERLWSAYAEEWDRHLRKRPRLEAKDSFPWMFSEIIARIRGQLALEEVNENLAKMRNSNQPD